MSCTGVSALLATVSTGESTSRNPLCTVCSAPPPEPPKLAVIRIREMTTSSASTARRRRTVLSCTGGRGLRDGGGAGPRGLPSASAAAAVAVLAGAVGAVNVLELLERAAGPDRDAGQGRLREVGRDLRLVADAVSEALQQGA